MPRQVSLLPGAAAFVILCCLAPSAFAGEIINDKKIGFTLSLPEGFVRQPLQEGTPASIVYGFLQGDPADDELDIILFIETLGGTINRERLKTEDMPAGFQGTLSTMQWQGFEVDAIRVPEQVGELETVTYNVQIPLKHGAIQVRMFGLTSREEEIKSQLAITLAGLDGESNWLRSIVPTVDSKSQDRYGMVLLAVAVVCVLGGTVVLWLISRYTPKGTALAIAVVIYLVGLSLSGIRVREVVLLTGMLKMLGVFGGILGIVDLLRSRRPKRKVAEPTAEF